MPFITIWFDFNRSTILKGGYCVQLRSNMHIFFFPLPIFDYQYIVYLYDTTMFIFTVK